MSAAHASAGRAATLRAVIFDMDGVLIDSADAHLESWRQLGKQLGVELTRERFLQTFGRQNRDVIPLLFGEGRTAEEIAALGEQKESIYRDLVRGKLAPLPGAVELVQACADAGLKLAVGSSGHPENIELALVELGIRPLIQAIVSGDDVTRGKPDPQVFLMAANRLGVEPKSCAVVEDAPAGIEASRASGMITVAVATSRPASQLRRAHLVVDSLTELSPARIASLCE
jgi:beta-phosphoglucomutase family hydrolase